MRLMLTAAAAAVKILLCKAISLVLLCGWLLAESRRQKAVPEVVPARAVYRRLERALVWIYGIAAVLSSAASGLLLRRMKFRHSFLIASVFFAGGAAGTLWRWKSRHARQKLMRLLHRAVQNSGPELPEN